jgi:CubicO group peptidase (beta-lactamase class C family)
MKRPMIAQGLKSFLLVLVFMLPAVALAQNKKDETPKPAQSLPELRQQLERILADTHTPGVSVAIVHRDGPEWIAGLGKSDVASNHATGPETLFRIGSTSKAFASLSILKLVDEGKLSLQDTVHQLIPEIWFENRWESTDPVRVVDLLEHTTGWDDMHLPEYAKDANGMTLRQGLDYYQRSRVSRWRPGTRMSYCNSGPPVAAYIVEKITGQRFEDYVTANFFVPIGTTTAKFRFPTGTSSFAPRAPSMLQPTTWRTMSSSISIAAQSAACRWCPRPISIGWRRRRGPGKRNKASRPATA